MTPILWMLLGAVAVFAAWRLYGVVKTPPRFLRLAYLFVDGAVWILCLVTVAILVSTFLSSDDSRVGSPIGLGGQGIEVEAPTSVYLGYDNSPECSLGVLILVGAIVLPLAQHGVIEWVVAEAGGEGGHVPWSLSFMVPALVGILVLALAEVWRYGVSPQRDAEATV